MKPKIYKLTDENLKTYGDCQWVLGEWKETNGNGSLCGPGWLHAYESKELAALLNPIHADFENPRLFECEWSGEVLLDKGLKLGVTRLRIVKEIKLPVYTTEQRVFFAIMCSLQNYDDAEYVAWALEYLWGFDRSESAAESAAARAASAWSAWSARSAAESARSAAWSAARSARAAARAAAESAAVAWSADKIDFASIVKQIKKFK